MNALGLMITTKTWCQGFLKHVWRSMKGQKRENKVNVFVQYLVVSCLYSVRLVRQNMVA